MSSLPRARRIIRGGGEHDDVFVLGQSVRETIPMAAPIARASELIAAAAHEAGGAVARGQAKAQAIVAEAQGSAASLRDAAYQDGFEAGMAAAAAEIESCLELVRKAASDGKAIRDSVAEQSAGLVAQAAVLAARRIVGEYYDADPARTAQACAEALRAASGQEILSIRVHPGLVDHIQGVLVDAARYIQPGEGIEIGGCIVDLRHGTLDATLDARLSMMELALREAGGEVAQ